MNCSNCQEKNHAFRECSLPVESHGILGYKMIEGQPVFLLVKRKDTMGYIDFLRGKYGNVGDIKTLIEEMTNDEQMKIKTLGFDELWEGLWVNKFSRPYVNEKRSSKIKFEKLDINLLFQERESRWESTEYCIPKGRKNFNESSKDCSIREFKEETGLKEDEFKIVEDGLVFVEKFYASNGVNYSHHYLLAEILGEAKPFLDQDDELMMGEIAEIKFFTFKESINIFRKYDTGKRSVLYAAVKSIFNLKK